MRRGGGGSTHYEGVIASVLNRHCFGIVRFHRVPVELVVENTSVHISVGFGLVVATICRVIGDGEGAEK